MQLLGPFMSDYNTVSLFLLKFLVQIQNRLEESSGWILYLRFKRENRIDQIKLIRQSSLHQQQNL